jgi:hypothetical protein
MQSQCMDWMDRWMDDGGAGARRAPDIPDEAQIIVSHRRSQLSCHSILRKSIQNIVSPHRPHASLRRRAINQAARSGDTPRPPLFRLGTSLESAPFFPRPQPPSANTRSPFPVAHSSAGLPTHPSPCPAAILSPTSSPSSLARDDPPSSARPHGPKRRSTKSHGRS